MLKLMMRILIMKISVSNEKKAITTTTLPYYSAKYSFDSASNIKQVTNPTN